MLPVIICDFSFISSADPCGALRSRRKRFKLFIEKKKLLLQTVSYIIAFNVIITTVLHSCVRTGESSGFAGVQHNHRFS